MTSNPTVILDQILITISYTGNRESFINDFLQIITLEALIQLSHLIPYDDVQHLKTELNSLSFDPLSFRVLLGSKIGSQTVNATFSQVTQKNLQDYLHHLLPSLSPEQVSSLRQLLSSL